MLRKLLKGILFFLLAVVLLFSGYAVVTGKTWLFKAVWYNFANIDDYRIFDNNTVAVGTPQPWPVSADFNKPVLPDTLVPKLEALKTVAVFVLRQDSALFARYWDGYSDSSRSNSFSVAKSITSLLIGIALKEGKIDSLTQRAGDFLPELKATEKGNPRIIDLLTMSSGSNWDESYANPLSVTTEAYYGSDLYKTATGIQKTVAPGSLHRYKSGDTELLGLILEKATGMTISAYASEKLWKPMGAMHPALWSTDKKGGNEKAYCCFNTNAPDFARLGQLMLDSGRWKGQEIVPKDYVRQSVTPCMIPDETGSPCNYYGFQWWIMPHRPEIFYARGILGQYIICIPQKRMVVVRLGEKTSPKRYRGVPEEVDDLVNWALAMR